MGGHRFRLGDQGGGAILRRRFLAEALDAEEGLCPMTPPFAAMLEEPGRGEGVVTSGTQAQPVDYAQFAPRIVVTDDLIASIFVRRSDPDWMARWGLRGRS